MKREIIIGGYHTAADGLWTLQAGWQFSPAVQKQNIIEVPGSSAVLDLSTSLTDGEPTYSSRTLTAVFESSEGDRLARKQRIDEMINRLDGYRFKITLPDDDKHYIEGRVSVQELYNDTAHASVQITAVCDPWRYANKETTVRLQATAAEQTATLYNQGRRPAVPTITVSSGPVNLTFDNKTWAVEPGTYALPDVFLKPGAHDLTYKGTGAISIVYREAVL